MDTLASHPIRKEDPTSPPPRSSTVSSSHRQPNLPKPPWGCLICGLVLNLSAFVSVKAEKVDSSEHRHRGDLYLPRGANVHSLAWVVETAEGCSISSITGDIRAKDLGVVQDGVDGSRSTGREMPGGYSQSQVRLSSKHSETDVPPSMRKDSFLSLKSCDSGDWPMKVMVLKQLTFFENTYLVAHPYFRIFSQTRRRWRSHRKRSLHSFYQAHVYNSTRSGHVYNSIRVSHMYNSTRGGGHMSYNSTIGGHMYNTNRGGHSSSKTDKRSDRGPLIKQDIPHTPHTLDSTTGASRTPVFQPPRSVPNNAAIFQSIEACMERYLASHPCVRYTKQEVLRPRKKRGRIDFPDPFYKEQWHLKNSEVGQYDLNVVGVWESGITGRGVTVCVIDDGLEWRHPDLRDNYNPAGSYDLNADDFDPSPVKNGESNEHGTRCAGEIAAATNSVCGVGVAYRANISGIRVLGGRMTDSMEAAAFIQGLDVNDIYSCSWGPDDDGRTVDGPHRLARRALERGVTHGRAGYGAVYVVASGNGGRNKDNCNFDGYANSVYTVTIGAVDSRGRMPYYAEECAAMLAVTPSSGSHGRGIVTTDWRELNKSGCTRQHSGTSAAAPLAAAVVALALEVHPCLSWRDVQYLIALTSRKIDARNSNWTRNGAGLHHSHQHGFGLVDAAAMVSAAAVWESVPFSTTYTSEKMEVKLEIRYGWKLTSDDNDQHGITERDIGVRDIGTDSRRKKDGPTASNKKAGIRRRPTKDVEKGEGTPAKGDLRERWEPVTTTHTVDEHTLQGYALSTLEFVQAVVSVEHIRRGTLRVELQCPSGTWSTLTTPRAADNSTKGLVEWALGTVRCWGEEAGGQYLLKVGQEGHAEYSGRLLSWRLILHGSPMSAEQFQDRHRLIARAVRGEAVNINRSTLCHQPELHFHPFTPLPPRWLKVLVITGVFLAFIAVFSSLEYVFCHNEEKKHLYLKLRDVAAGRAYYHHPRRTTQGRVHPVPCTERGQQGETEEGTARGRPEEEESLLVMTDGEGRESVSMSMVSQKRVICSPSPSCDADISSLDDDDGTDDDAGTSDTVVPRDTTDAATDLTNDEFMSEADDDPSSRGGSGAGLRGH